jgi:hypothetical protein
VGRGSTIQPKQGGAVLIRYPGGAEAVGEVVEIAPPERIAFTYGYASGQMIPAGGSVVTIRLEPHEEGTRVLLTHAYSDQSVLQQHVQGWRYQLSLFSNVVADEALSGATEAVDAWFMAWSTTDGAARHAVLTRIAAPGVTFRDRFSAIDGIGELNAHIEGALKFMPGVRPQRAGAIRRCQGMVLADWTAPGGGAQAQGQMAGTNVFVFGPDARIASVVGFWRDEKGSAGA